MNSRILQNSEMPGERSVYNGDLATVSQIAEFLQLPNSWVYERTRRSGPDQMPYFNWASICAFPSRMF